MPRAARECGAEEPADGDNARDGTDGHHAAVWRNGELHIREMGEGERGGARTAT